MEIIQNISVLECYSNEKKMGYMTLIFHYDKFCPLNFILPLRFLVIKSSTKLTPLEYKSTELNFLSNFPRDFLSLRQGWERCYYLHIFILSNRRAIDILDEAVNWTFCWVTLRNHFQWSYFIVVKCCTYIRNSR